MNRTSNDAAAIETPGAPLAGPATPAERLLAVDVLRGVAALGILLVNIDDFGMPSNSHLDLLGGGIRNPDVASWAVVEVLFEGKLRAIFSMLFGAGVILLTSRLERRGEGENTADIYYRRTLWLLAFGLVHAYSFWEFDILYDYAVSGLFLFPFRKIRGAGLICLGLFVLALTVPWAVITAYQLEDLRHQAEQANADEAAGEQLSKEQRHAQVEWRANLDHWQPDAEAIQRSIDDHHGSYGRSFVRRAGLVAKSQSKGYYNWAFFDTTGMMLVGMGLMKLGVFSAALPARYYAAMVLLGFGFGVPLHAYAAYYQYIHQFKLVDNTWIASTYNPGRLAIALGHIGLVILVVQAGIAPWLTTRLAEVGRMALTNYLATTIICLMIFDGYGFGFFGSLRRYQLQFVVLGVWASLILVSFVWLRAFVFGPAEWVWRSLTYWKLQRLRR